MNHPRASTALLATLALAALACGASPAGRMPSRPTAPPSEREGRRQRNRGGSGIVTPLRDDEGAWHATRDVVLEH